MRKVYADNGSTSFPKAPGVGEAMKNYIEEVGCNIARGGYDTAYELMDKVFETRSLMLQLFGLSGGDAGLDEHNVVFVPSVTYALNFIMTGLLRPGDHLIVSAMEHNAVARPAEALRSKGVDVTYAACGSDGLLDMEDLRNSFRENTRLVVITMASNVSGTLQDVETVGRICAENNVPLVLDAAQAAGSVSIDFIRLGLSALCVPGHKGLMGPQGIGAMIIKSELAEAVAPIVLGGTGSISDSLLMPDFLPDKFEAGTLNLPGIIGLNHALRYVISETPARILEHERNLADRFIRRLREMQGIQVSGPEDMSRRTGVVSVNFTALDNADAAYRLDEEFGIMTRCGLHCAPLAHRTLGTYPQGTVRFSFGYFNTEEEVDYIADSISKIL